MKAYLANGLFSEADVLYNELLAKQLREALPGIELYVPQENGDINDKTAYANSLMIAQADTEKLVNSDFLVAVLDHMDEGVMAEIGLFSTTGKPIFGLFTDSRQQGRENQKKIDALIDDPVENQFPYVNLFVVGCIKKNGKIFSTRDELIDYIVPYTKDC